VVMHLLAPVRRWLDCPKVKKAGRESTFTQFLPEERLHTVANNSLLRDVIAMVI